MKVGIQSVDGNFAASVANVRVIGTREPETLVQALLDTQFRVCKKARPTWASANQFWDLKPVVAAGNGTFVQTCDFELWGQIS